MSTPTPNKPRVLGIDPGFDRLGIAVVEGNTLLFSHCLETNKKDSLDKRLHQVGEAVRKIIEEWQPQVLAIEKLFFNQNTSSALKVAEARGVTIYEAVRAELQISEYSPQEIKIAVTSDGRADKKQVAFMVEKLIKLDVSNKKRLDDELDAIALCITHLATAKSF